MLDPYAAKQARKRRRLGSHHRLRLENLEPRLVLFNGMVISEFVASNSGGLLDGDGSSSDWVELYNPTASAIDISGWHLTDDSAAPTKWSFPNQSVTAGDYLVVFASGQAIDNYVDPLGYLHTNFKLGTSGEYLGLTDSNGAVVYEYAPSFPGQSADVSYGLNLAEEPVFFTNPTPGALNDDTSAVSLNVSITEIMYHPASEIDAEEFIEIYNGEATSLNLAGWSLRGGVDFDFPSMILSSGDYLVVAADVDTFTTLYPTVTNVVGGWQGTLSNSTENVRLVNDLGVQVDLVEYADAGEWATRERGPVDRNHEGWVWSDDHDGGGSSLEVVQSGLLNSAGQNWSASINAGGTPGSANSVAVSDSAPLILDINHLPIIPSSTDNVVITARLIDELTTGMTATVEWRVDGDPVFSSIAMTDDGSGADTTAGDGLFTAVIPPQADGTVVEWYISASDASANVRTHPTASLPSGLQETNLLYQVDDSFDPTMLPVSGEMREYRLIMTEVERAELEQIGSSSSEARTNAQMNGTFIAATPSGLDIRYNVGLRNRGNGSRDNLPNNIRVNIPSDRPWKGIDQFNLNTQYTHLQLAGLRLYEAAGLPTEDSRPVMVQVNGSNLAAGGDPAYGVYIQIEANNSEFTKNHFPEDGNGNLYRGSHEDDFDGNLAYRGTDPADYLGSYIKKTNEAQDDWSDLIHLTDVLTNTSNADYLKEVKKVVDIDNWLGYFAVIASLGTEETMLGTGDGDDYLLYIGNNDPRAVLIPHDFDAILGTGESTGDPLGSIHEATDLPIIERFLTHPDIAPLYHARLLELMETTFAKANFDPFIDSLVGDFAPASEIQDIKDFMDERRAFITTEVTRSITWNSALTTIGGFPTSTQNFAGVLGTAPLASSRSILVDGQLADFDPFLGTWFYGETLGGSSESIIDSPHFWNYLDGGQEPPAPTPGADWRVDDPGWTDSGPSPLGYGDSKVVTNVEYIDTDPVASGTQKNITTYYRTEFNLTNASEFTSLNLGLQRDDGAIAYLNGTEIARTNMPSGAVNSATTASGTTGSESTFFQFTVDPLLLLEGQNVLAVEIHQANDSSSDTIFDLTLDGTRGNPMSTSGVDLSPGINRIPIQAFDGINGTGNLVDEGFVDIWHDDGNSTAFAGPITTNTTWTAANSPYVVSSNLDITDGTLTIEPGVTVFFDPDVTFTVSGTGHVVAEGTAADPIRFSHNPLNGTGNWGGLNFVNTQTDNRFVHVDFQSGDAQGNATFIDHGRVLFDMVSWFDVENQVLELEHPTLIVRNSHIPGISGDETIHLVGIDVGEQLVFENNIIGKNTSGGDVVDLAPDSLNRQPIYFTNNTFLGGFDDGVDTDGNIVIFEGNTFRDFHLNTSRTTTSNAISTGHQNVGATTLYSELTIRNNTFYDIDHALLIKDFGSVVFENNTVVKATVGGIQLQELSGSNVLGPGQSADLDGNIFSETPLIFEAVHANTQLTVNNTILLNEVVDFGGTLVNAHDLGVGNFDAAALLANPAKGDFSLTEGSPAFFAGPNGTDIGAIQAPRYPAADATNLQITELHYNPLPGSPIDPLCEVPADGDWFEFIEFYNYGNDTIDASNVTFNDGVEFTFPWGTTIAPGERVVIVKDEGIFESRYGTGLPVIGEYTSKLSNSGETVQLNAADGTQIAEITYGDQSATGWPVAADGDGPSLDLIAPGQPHTSFSTPTVWQNGASGGTPGTGTILLPCDYVNIADGCDITDIDALYAGTNGAPTPLTMAAITQWLSEASDPANQLKTNPADVYVFGDANLDGDVDSTDLGLHLNNFGDTSGLGWGSGNFNDDGDVDSIDLGLLLNNFGFTSLSVAAGSASVAIPTFNPQTIEFVFEQADEEESDEDAGPAFFAFSFSR